MARSGKAKIQPEHLAGYDGTQWCTQTIAEENLNDIFKGGSSLYVVGDGNTFLKFDY